MPNEDSEIWGKIHESSKKKRNANLQSAIEILNRNRIAYERKSDSHFRIGPYDFWPTTGLFINRKTGKRRRGILNLLIHLRK